VNIVYINIKSQLLTLNILNVVQDADLVWVDT
jgi:hypothetical protein